MNDEKPIIDPIREKTDPMSGDEAHISNGVNVRALAELTRLAISDEEIGKLQKELPSILTFVEMIQSVPADKLLTLRSLGEEVRNVMRADENPHESGTYTEVLLSAAPARQGDRIAVKQVVSRNKKNET
ncbi:aspartyl/glutamyl-tRNA amidotransferase subunit C [Candidatus Kaiserbacteria bacterium]|nr:aspartyl/glutamyl-tRNA amidotransferase subunit C [Candidatus Kaiserbacteria bacterium]